MAENYAIELQGITKTFGSFIPSGLRCAPVRHIRRPA